jgi:hypothetical protein
VRCPPLQGPGVLNISFKQLLVPWLKSFDLKGLLVIICFLALGAPSFAQDIPSLGQAEPRETYLIVRIQKQDGKQVDKFYYTIEAEPFNDYALDLYNLEPFKKNYFVPKAGVAFYYNRPDSATLYYNYFKSETEALDFMGKQNWRLVTVLNEISSGYKTAGIDIDGPPYTTVSSRPVYYFRKTVDD